MAIQVRIHLPSGVSGTVAAMQLQRGDGPRVALAFTSPAGLVDPTNPPIGGTGSVVVEATVNSLTDQEQTVHFEVMSTSNDASV